VASKAKKRRSGFQKHNNQAFLRYQAIRVLIDKNFLKFRSVEQVAIASNLSVSYVSRLFKRFCHQTPYEYLLRQRMQFAAKLLANPKAQIDQVVRQLEFADQFHFSRVFKRYLGVSPAQFRKN
jgi:AraC-like DNA-binding protein